MSESPLQLLLVEDSEADAELLLRGLRGAGLVVDCERVDDVSAMRAALQRHAWDVVVADWWMPTFGAQRAIAVVAESGSDLPCIVVSGTIGEEVALEAMRAGARDFVRKHQPARLAQAILREVREHRGPTSRNRGEAALRAMLAGGATHDFKDLLSVIISHAELAMQDLAQADPLRSELGEILAAGRRVAALASQRASGEPASKRGAVETPEPSASGTKGVPKA